MLATSPILAQSNQEAGGFALLLGLGGCVGLLFYFLPFVVASFRGHHNTAAIFILNLLLGWSFIGWVVALVWAFTEVRGHGGSGVVHDRVVPKPSAKFSGWILSVAVFIVIGVVVWGGIYFYLTSQGGFGSLFEGGGGLGPGALGQDSAKDTPPSSPKVRETTKEPARSICIEVLAPKDLADEKYYRVQGEEGTKSLAELKDYFRERQWSQPGSGLQQVAVCLYRDSPARETSIVHELVRWLEDIGVRVELSDAP